MKRILIGTVAAVAVAGCVSFMEDRDADGFVRFDGRMPQEAPSEYFVLRFERPDGSVIESKRVFSPGANLPEALDSDTTTCVFAKSELKGETDLRVIVRPVNCWGTMSCKKTAVCRIR